MNTRITLTATLAITALALGAAASLHRSHGAQTIVVSEPRLDVNGEPLSYNAPCSTDTDCAARFGY